MAVDIFRTINVYDCAKKNPRKKSKTKLCLSEYKFYKMADILTPPEGQSSFSGIPLSEFVEDVDSYMKGEESAEAKLKVSF